MGTTSMNEQKQDVFAVDGDTLAYRTAAVCETHFEGACESILRATLRDIVTDTGITKLRIYLTGKDNFRYVVAKTKPYKGNRATMQKPQFLQHCRDFLVNEMQAVVVDGFEADDAIASDMVQNGAFHCGVDKDIYQIPGKHYNYVEKTWKEVTPEEATLRLYRQILTGDASDNIPGLPRVGEKTALSVITNHETALQDAMRFYEDTVREKMHGVNWLEYMAEQTKLIAMVTNLELNVDRFLLLAPDTSGFTSQEGDFVGEPVETVKKVIKL